MKARLRMQAYFQWGPEKTHRFTAMLKTFFFYKALSLKTQLGMFVHILMYFS